MQDHRNWCDANWKTYGTPLEYGFPMDCAAGQRFEQTVTISVSDSSGPAGRSSPRRRAPSSWRSPSARGRLAASIGVDASGAVPSAGVLETVAPAFLRVTVDDAALAEHHRLVALGIPVEVVVQLAGDDPGSTRSVVETLAASGLSVRRVICMAAAGAFSAFRGATPAELVDAWRSAAAGTPVADVPVYSGANQSYNVIARDRPRYAAGVGIVFAANPQVHACDDESVMENTAAFADVVRDCRRLYPGRPVAISPVQLIGDNGPFPGGPPASPSDRPRTTRATTPGSPRRGRSPSSPPSPARRSRRSACSMPSVHAASPTPTGRSSQSARSSASSPATVANRHDGNSVRSRRGRRARRWRQDGGRCSSPTSARAAWGTDHRLAGDGRRDPGSLRRGGAAMKRPVTTLVEGLGHPEGPDVLPDGRIVMVETYTGKLVAWSAELGCMTTRCAAAGRTHASVGSDGAVYLTQNGGTAGAWKAAVMSVPSIQRAWPDGRCETVADTVAGLALQAPNDLTFGPDGRLYFTDPADYDPNDRQPGRVFAIDADGTGELLEEVPESFPNGIAVESDGSIVWVDSYGRGVFRRSADGRSEQICRLPEGHIPDGLKVDVVGNLWITGYSAGGVDIVRPDGAIVDFLDTGGCPLNCVFHDNALFITDLGDVGGVSDDAFMGGRLLHVDVGVEGMALFRGAIT